MTSSVEGSYTGKVSPLPAPTHPPLMKFAYWRTPALAWLDDISTSHARSLVRGQPRNSLPARRDRAEPACSQTDKHSQADQQLQLKPADGLNLRGRDKRCGQRQQRGQKP